MIKLIKKIWNGMDEQNKILIVYMLFLALLVLVSII
jgi:energy-converting hydrogenase Eha subunit F